MNINHTTPQISFGTLKLHISNMGDEEDKEVLKAIEPKLPGGTEMKIEDLWCGESSDVTIMGPSEEAELKIAEALKAAAFANIEIEPFVPNPKMERIQAATKVLEG